MTYNFKKSKPLSDTMVYTLVDAFGDEQGTITVKRMDTSNPKYLLGISNRMKVLSPAERKRVQEPKTEADVIASRAFSIKSFVEDYVTDSAILDNDGAVIPHSTEMVIAFLSVEDHYEFYREVENFALEKANFAKKAVEETKNDSAND